MKNYLILAMILIAGMTAYPQATKTARESRSEKGSTKKEATHRSEAKTDSKSGSEKKVESTPRQTRSENRSANVERSKTNSNRSETNQTRVETRSSDRSSSNRSNNEATRSKVETRSADRPQVKRSTDEPTRRSEDQDRVKTTTRQRNETGNAERRQETTITRPENRTSTGGTSTRNNRESVNSDNRDFKVNSSSASRTYREGRGTLTRDDGTVIRHQNDEVFASRKYRLDYDNYQNLRRSDEFRRHYDDYDGWYHRRHIRVYNHNNYHYNPIPWEVRRHRYYYRQPHHIDLIWTPLLFHRFMFYYPTHYNWEMEFGSPIETISANEAQEYAGTLRRVYGKVDEVFYSPDDGNYVLYIGAPFPYHDLSIVIPKDIAHDISRSPKWYFEDEYVWVVGLINIWEGKPEIIIRDEDQIKKY